MLLSAQQAQPEALGAYLYANRSQVASYAFLGGLGTLPNGVRAEAQHALRAPPFSNARAMGHIKVIAGFGPRKAGGSAERKTADYVASQLQSYGYTVTFQTVTLPGGLTSRNVIAEKPGTSSQVLVIGGHMDSKYPSPGANDNASGVAVTLELARVLAMAEGTAPTVRFIGFAAEEIAGATPTDHHFGSRQYVAALSSAGKARIESMLSVDMVGYGTTFNVRNLQKAPMTTVKSLRAWGAYCGQPLPYLMDFGRSGWSDHEAFEFAGIPVAWLEWRDDPVYHTTRDTYGHVQPDRVARTGRLLRGWVLNLTPGAFEALR
jgi:Zn-dependent M28 family amino/carboxypeptidase